MPLVVNPLKWKCLFLQGFCTVDDHNNLLLSVSQYLKGACFGSFTNLIYSNSILFFFSYRQKNMKEKRFLKTRSNESL